MVHALLLTLLLATTASVPPPDASLRIDRFNQEIGATGLLGDAERAKAIRESFHSTISTLDIPTLHDEELGTFFVAALNASSLARDRDIAVVARHAFDELDARNALAENDYGNMQGLYVRLREFDKALGFRLAFGGRASLEEVPSIGTSPAFDATKPSQFTVIDQQHLVLGNASTSGNFVLVIADPSCHFTRDAVISITDDPQLHAYFAQHSKWLAPDGLSLRLDAVVDWNQALPDFALSLVNDIHAWDGVEYWDTPTFYFYEAGKVVRTIRGWPPEGHLTELKEAIRRTGP
jgi:hypothetical protein